MIECFNSSLEEISDNAEQNPKFVRTFTEEFKPNPKYRMILIFSIFFFVLQYV